jgi:hypothetical protein
MCPLHAYGIHAHIIEKANQHPPRASLLGLPPEIRNQIYDEVLLGDDMVDLFLLIDKTNHQDPALLRVCRLLREEATSVYRKNVAFDLMVEELKLAPQPQHWIWNELDIKDIVYDRPWYWDLDNLIEWLRPYHEGATAARFAESVEYYDFSAQPCYEFLVSAFDHVEELKEEPWGVLEKGLRSWSNSFFKAIELAEALAA